VQNFIKKKKKKKKNFIILEEDEGESTIHIDNWSFLVDFQDNYSDFEIVLEFLHSYSLDGVWSQNLVWVYHDSFEVLDTYYR
jgi:hypothetical protein